MNLKTTFSFLLLFFCICLQASAQLGFGKPEDITALKQRKLIVVLRETNSKKAADIAYVKEFNEVLKRAVPNFWTYNTDITYMTKDEVSKLIKAKDKSHAVLEFSIWNVTNYSSNGINGMRYATDSWKSSTLDVSLIEKSNKAVASANLPSLYPSEGDLAGAMQMIQHYMDNRLAGKSGFDVRDEIKTNSKELQNKTLLLDKKEIAKLTSAEIKEAYGLPYKVVDYNVIEEAILSKDPAYAYVQITPISVRTEVNFIQYVLSAEDGKLLGWSAPLATIKGVTSGARIKKNNLKNFAKYSDN